MAFHWMTDSKYKDGPKDDVTNGVVAILVCGNALRGVQETQFVETDFSQCISDCTRNKFF